MNSMVTSSGIQTKHNNKMIAKKTSAKKEDVPVFLMKVSVRFLCVLFGSGCVAEHSLCLGGMWDRVWPAAGAVPLAHSNAPIHQLEYYFARGGSKGEEGAHHHFTRRVGRRRST